MPIFCLHQHLKKCRPKLGSVSKLKFCCMTIFCKMGVIYPLFHNGQCNFPLVQFLLHHATSSLVQFSIFKHDDISVLKTSMGSPLQHSHMITFLYLEVDNGQCKFSIGSVSHHHTNLGSVFNIQV